METNQEKFAENAGPYGNRTTVYREEVVLARQAAWLGAIKYSPKRAYKILTAISCGLTFALAAFLYFGEITKKVKSVGILLPMGGLVNITAPRLGAQYYRCESTHFIPRKRAQYSCHLRKRTLLIMTKIAALTLFAALGFSLNVFAGTAISLVIFVDTEHGLYGGDLERLKETVYGTNLSCAPDQQARFILTELDVSSSNGGATRRTAILAASLAEFGVTSEQIVQRSTAALEATPNSTLVGGAVTVLAVCVKAQSSHH